MIQKANAVEFIKQFYAGTPYIPAELMLPEEIEDQRLSEWLTTRREHKVRLRIPKKGTKEKLVELAQKITDGIKVAKNV